GVGPAQGDSRRRQGDCASRLVLLEFRRRLGKLEGLAAGRLPATREELRQLPGYFLPDEVSLDVVKGLVGFTPAEAERIGILVAPVVPPVIAQIEAAEESELAVDHYELLVVRPLVCVIAVEKEREPIVRGPIEAQLLHPFALQ